MTIREMHEMFRQYSQQMGMQNVRAILPEQIDLLINNSINDTINQIVTQNIGITNDRVITDNSKLNQVNALRSLYRIFSYNLGADAEKLSGHITGYSDYISSLLGNNQYLFIVDASISYKKSNSMDTSIFPVRIIDDMYLADVLNDFILCPRFRSPIMTIHDDKFEIYIDEKTKLTELNLAVNRLRVSYIAKPAVVAYLTDVGGTDVNCDLPEYLHVDIVKHAVELYRTAVTGSIAVTQQAQEAQQRENLRNNYRQGDNDNSNR